MDWLTVLRSDARSLLANHWGILHANAEEMLSAAFNVTLYTLDKLLSYVTWTYNILGAEPGGGGGGRDDTHIVW